MNLHHVGFVAERVEFAERILRLSKDSLIEVVKDHQQGNLIYIYKSSAKIWIEIVVPAELNSTVGNFSKKHKFGLHHIAFPTLSINVIKAEMSNSPYSVILGEYELEVLAFGGRIKTLFVSTMGTIIEYVEVVDENS